MKKVFLFATLAVATVFNLGYIAYGKYNAMSQADKLVFDNIEALSAYEHPAYTSGGCSASTDDACSFKCEKCNVIISGTGVSNVTHICAY
ncbi:hypothetical protein MR532_07570 [bacterium]|nr:hypothetical protein [bacterium]